ncbi:hypothetical protein BCAR13_810024 [Paraburkholderia caribensis]|nr:hypothetical protein BCAR13_810024 [Paraburkholderia caribensis]
MQLTQAYGLLAMVFLDPLNHVDEESQRFQNMTCHRFNKAPARSRLSRRINSARLRQVAFRGDHQSVWLVTAA